MVFIIRHARRHDSGTTHEKKKMMCCVRVMIGVRNDTSSIGANENRLIVIPIGFIIKCAICIQSQALGPRPPRYRDHVRFRGFT